MRSIPPLAVLLLTTVLAGSGVLPDNRYVAGTTSPMWYRGRVSPYFNLHPPAVPSVIK